MRRVCALLIIAVAMTLAGGSASVAAEKDIFDRVEHHYADSDGVKIHYVSIGEGPLVVFIHGFPDFWYSWADQMEELSSDFKCVAVDLRGYNKSDKPKGVENYDMTLLVGDILAVIKANGAESATVVGHDWGGGIAWAVALGAPQAVNKLIICNLPHRRGLNREMAINDEHRANTGYARTFQDPDAHKGFTAQGFATMIASQSGDMSDARKARYQAAFEASDFDAMLNYYRRNYNPVVPEKAELPYKDDSPLVKAEMPILMFHGLNDRALHHHALNNTWEWVEKDLTIVTIPGVGHWVHHEAADLVSQTMKWWLLMRQ